MNDKINAKQIEIVNNIRSGLTGIPETSNELADLVVSALLAVDHDEIERDSLARSRVGFLRAYMAKGGGFAYKPEPFNGVYLSQIKDAIKGRRYFKGFHKLTRTRGADGFSELYRGFIKEGKAVRIGEKIKFNVDVNELIEKERLNQN